MIFMISGRARAGKDTFAQVLLQIIGGSKRYAFADDLKELAKDLGWNGEKDSRGRDMLIVLGQIMRGEYVVHGRRMYSTITKEVVEGRPDGYGSHSYSLMDLHFKATCTHNLKPVKSYWVDRVLDRIHSDDPHVAIISDWRFLSEYDDLSQVYSEIYTFRVENRSSLLLTDRSETELDDFDFNYYIDNNGTVEDLQKLAKAIWTEIIERRR